MSVLIVGSVALDTVKTPLEEHADLLGGSASYAAVGASFFSKVNFVGVVGDDFPTAHVDYFQTRQIDLTGLQTVPGRKSYSEDTAQRIDAEVRAIIKTQYDRAYALIHGNRDKLEIIANSLLEFETLDGAQVEEIIRTGKFTPPPPPPKDVEPPMGAQAVTTLPEVMKSSPPKLPGLGDAAPAPA